MERGYLGIWSKKSVAGKLGNFVQTSIHEVPISIGQKCKILPLNSGLKDNEGEVSKCRPPYLVEYALKLRRKIKQGLLVKKNIIHQ